MNRVPGVLGREFEYPEKLSTDGSPCHRREVTTAEEGGVTYYQFDTVFFEEVEDDSGSTFYEVVGSPDGSDEEVET